MMTPIIIFKIDDGLTFYIKITHTKQSYIVIIQHYDLCVNGVK
jgi:hypothetical protein